MSSKREGLLRRAHATNSLRVLKIVVAIGFAVVLGCVLGSFIPHGFLGFHPFPLYRRLPNSTRQVVCSPCQSNDRVVNMLNTELVTMSKKNSELKERVRELAEKLRLAQKRFLLLGAQQKAGPFGTGKGLRMNLTLVSRSNFSGI